MKAKRIQKIFKEFFKYPNPIFEIPVLYFKHENYLCEVARTKSIHDCEWSNNPYSSKSPLLIFEALFVDDGYFITVLERKSQGVYEHRSDLGTHIDSLNIISNFISTKLS